MLQAGDGTLLAMRGVDVGSRWQSLAQRWRAQGLFGAVGFLDVHAALTGRTVNIADAYDAEGFDFSGTRAFDARTGYRSQSFLTVPMKDHDGHVIGVLQLINAKGPDGAIMAFAPAIQQLVESLASQAAIALNNRRLIDQLETLFEALINLINTAIDEKSPYTGGHCERVPALTTLLADAEIASSHGRCLSDLGRPA